MGKKKKKTISKRKLFHETKKQLKKLSYRVITEFCGSCTKIEKDMSKKKKKHQMIQTKN